jgi:hypothetical protein
MYGRESSGWRRCKRELDDASEMPKEEGGLDN